MDIARNTNQENVYRKGHYHDAELHGVQNRDHRREERGVFKSPQDLYREKLQKRAQEQRLAQQKRQARLRATQMHTQKDARHGNNLGDAMQVKRVQQTVAPKVKKSFAQTMQSSAQDEAMLQYLSENSPRSRYFTDESGPGHFGDKEFGQGVADHFAESRIEDASVQHVKNESRKHAVYQLGQKQASESVPFFGISSYMPEYADIPRYTDEDVVGVEDGQYGSFSVVELFKKSSRSHDISVSVASYRFMVTSFVSMIMLSSALFVGHAFAVKDRIEHSASEAVGALQYALMSAQDGDFGQAQEYISFAQQAFVDSQEDLSTINRFIISMSQYVPGASKLASGDALVEASIDLTKGVEHAAYLGEIFANLEVLSDEEVRNEFSFLRLINDVFEHTHKMEESFVQAQVALEEVRIADVPDVQKDEFLLLTNTLPDLIGLLQHINDMDHAINDVFGANGPRKYLFLFQNNHEMRATGGFIGSYGFLDLNEGKVREFKIDGIYNPDGQLTDKIVPPRPIQKISAAWSLHDSNWWPDFPKSAQKAIEFYERTGGPTVDGVITMTPVIVERLLELTGPITMDEYGVTLTSKNFIEKTQYKVEVDYDKDENRPKKILSDLMPALMESLKRDMTAKKALDILQVFFDGLNERHILIYAENNVIQKAITDQHWGGSLLTTSQDYMSVVHSNINGFKTDGVIDENIEHHTSIESDGRVINTVTVTRTHNGGSTGYEWWDSVNADFMRIYVPLGSRLISAEGHTREINDPRLNYDALGFERDRDVESEERSLEIDPVSGTRIYEDSGKTVFGNWVYVSPQEVVRVIYVYELPWRVQFDVDEKGEYGSYGVVHQKQAGANNVKIASTITLPESMYVISAVPSQDVNQTQESFMEASFTRDYYHGIVFRIK